MLSFFMGPLAGVLVGMFKEAIVGPILQVYLKSKDVDLEKFKAATPSLEHATVAVLDANVKFASIQAGYATSVLQWWPFRLILFMVLAIASIRFSLIMIDATLPKLFNYASWDIDPIKGDYGKAELQFILFFIIAKPVDTAVSGAVNVLSRYLSK